MRAVRLIALPVAAFFVAACPSKTLTADDIFVPNEPSFVAETEADLYIDGEEIYAAPSAYKLSFEILGAPREVSVSRADHMEASVEHGFATYNEAGDRLAWTLISQTPQPEAPRPLIVMCGGNSFSRYSAGVGYSLPAIEHGDVLLFDYPGTGDTKGEATLANFEAASDTVRSLAEETAGEARGVVFWGHSLGGFVCAEMASQSPRAAGMIIEASARNLQDIADAWRPWYIFFGGWRVDEALARYDIVDTLQGFDPPILILAGTRDRVLPRRLSSEIFAGLEAAGRDVEMVSFETGHNTIVLAAGFDGVMDRFLEGISATPN